MKKLYAGYWSVNPWELGLGLVVIGLIVFLYFLVAGLGKEIEERKAELGCDKSISIGDCECRFSYGEGFIYHEERFRGRAFTTGDAGVALISGSTSRSCFNPTTKEQYPYLGKY